MTNVAQIRALDSNPISEAETALEEGFPIVQISEIAEQESWRKEINRPIYHIHKWWATRLGSVFRAINLAALSPPSSNTWDNFYKRHSLTGKVVLDPFMGSGTTLGEALKLGAKAVGCDINPVSSFLVRQAFTRVKETQLRDTFLRLEADIAPAIRHFYQTRDPESGEAIPVLYYFWVKVLSTPDGEAVPLMSRYVFAQDAYPTKKPRAHIVCPGCWGLIEARYDTTSVSCPHCAIGFNPQQGPAQGQHVTTVTGKRYRIKDLLPANGTPPAHRLYALLALRPNGTKLYLAARAEDRALYHEAEKHLEGEDLPLPTLAVRPGHNTDQARGYHYNHWRDFFNARQLLCLGMLLKSILKVEDLPIQEQLLCLFSSTLEFNNLFCSYKGEGTGAVRHMFSNHILKPERTPLENSVWGTDKSSGTFSTLFESRLIRAKRYLDDPFEIGVGHDLFGGQSSARKVSASGPINAPCVATWDELLAKPEALLILNGDSAILPLPNRSVDAVITDPPYFDFVHYSELSDFFFAWLSPALKGRYPWFNKVDSSDVGEVQQKDPRLFASQLGRVFAESRRVLKDEGVLAFSFHHSRPEGWAAIYEAVAHAGLYIVAAHPVHAELRAASPKTAAKDPISLDAILVCRKTPRVGPLARTVDDVVFVTDEFVKILETAQMTISSADHFVIGASQMLIAASPELLSYDEIVVRLEELKDELSRRISIDPIERRGPPAADGSATSHS
jgi:putative DNA methylase